jgi:hypothetical protein
MIKAVPPEESSRDVDTASKRLTCAADISSYALNRVSKIVSGAGRQADLDEIKYLAGEATNALEGKPLGVECNSSGALKFAKAPDIDKILPAYKAALDNIVRHSQGLYEMQNRAVSAQKKIDEARKRVEDPKNDQKPKEVPEKTAAAQPGEPAARSTGDSDIAKAYAQQKAWQAKDQDKINQVNEEQKKMQQQQIDALAVLRKAQEELNAVDSQKVSTAKALTQDAREIQQLNSGNLP